MKTPLTIEGDGVMARALAWLESRHGAAATRAVDAMLYSDVGEAERQALENLDAATAHCLARNAAEWLLAEGRIDVDGTACSAAACVLAADGPQLSVAERAWLTCLAHTPLRFYEVVDMQPDGTLSLRDALAADATSFTVIDTALGVAPPPGTRLGLRVLEFDGRRELSGAVYVFSRVAGAGVAVQLRESAELFGASRADLPQLLSMLIRHCWLAQYCEPKSSAPTVKFQSAPTAACHLRDKNICPGVRAHAQKGDKAVGDKIEQDLVAALMPKK